MRKVVLYDSSNIKEKKKKDVKKEKKKEKKASRMFIMTSSEGSDNEEANIVRAVDKNRAKPPMSGRV